AGFDHQDPGGLRLLGDEAEHLDQSRAQPCAPTFADVRGGCNPPVEPFCGGIEGGDEALLLIGEVLVEGRPRDPGALEHVLDVDLPVALLGDREAHRGEDSLSLDGADQLRRQADPAAVGWELPVGVDQQLVGGGDVAWWPVLPDSLEQLFLTQLDPLWWHQKTSWFL